MTETSQQGSKTTARDRIWSQVLTSDEIKWTTQMMVTQTEDVSEETVRDTFNAMTELDILSHKKGSEYWYVVPAYA